MLWGFARSWCVGSEAASEDREEEEAEDVSGAAFCFFPSGGLLAFDDSYEHEVWQNGATDRTTLVLHVMAPGAAALWGSASSMF